MIFRKLITLLLSGSILLISCASLTPPNGGPDDKTGPDVSISSPVSGAINVSTNTKISVTFSEWISTKEVKSVSIFPPVPFKTKLSTNKLEVYPLSKLQDTTTYHVLITSALKDLHGNPVSPVSLIFSTGPTLDSGSLQGCVIDPSKKSSQYRVALFSEKDLSDSGICGTPSYLLQTDTTGHFDFNNLKIASYHAIAYIDVNNDAHLQPGTEQVFITEDSVTRVEKSTPKVSFFPAVFDTAFPSIKTLKPSSSRVINGSWNKSYDTLVFLPVQVSIERIDSLQILQNTKIIPVGNDSTLALITDQPLKIAPYRVIISITRVFDKQISLDTILFNGVNTVDSSGPQLKLKPDSNKVFDLSPKIKIGWTEPAQIVESLFFVNKNDDTIAARVSQGYSDTATISPKSRLNPETVYSIVFPRSSVKDLSGNVLSFKDSTANADTVFFRTIQSDSIATSLSGALPCSTSTQSEFRTWFYQPLNSTNKYFAKDNSGSFTFDSIPSGKGQIGYFIDKNNNMTTDKGRLYPWYSPEPYFFSSDTVEARARWDIEGISVPLCEPCRDF